MTWHHAYNGIPTVRNTGGKTGRGFAGDYAPSGQDRLAPDTVSGELDLTITVASPTIPGQSTKDRRVVVASRTGAPEGARTWEDAAIPVTTLKGVLSSAYEAVTASRMRVFTDHDHVLTHRRTTQEAATLYPVLLVCGGPDRDSETGLSARIMLGKNNPKSRGWNWRRPQYVCAAVLPDSQKSVTAFYSSKPAKKYSRSRKQSKQKHKHGVSTADVDARLEQLRKSSRHLAPVTFTVKLENFYNTKRAIVVGIGNKYFLDSRPKRKKHNTETHRGVIVRLTPPHSDPLTETKYNEFVFFDTETNRTYLPVCTDVLEQLVEVIHSYLENIRQLVEHEKTGTPGNSKSRKSTDPKTWLIHEIANGKIDDNGQILGASDRKADKVKDSAVMADRAQIKQFLLKLASKDPGIPLFASISNKGNITGLTPSQVGRRTAPGSLAPVKLAEKSGVAPARTFAQASAGDRMWGFVADEDEKEEGAGQAAAVRGRITIRPITPVLPGQDSWLRSPEPTARGWFLPTLASPKPATGAPYLRDKSGRALPETTTRARTYQPEQTLIRKVYPTHRKLIGREDLPNSTPLEGDIGPHDTVVGSFLAPGAKFTTTLAFDGLTPQELAVLVWLLTPESLVPPNASPEDESMRRGFHRLGFGKPLGLGAVEIRATDVHMHTGESLAGMYMQLDGCLGCTPIDATTTAAADRLADALSALPKGFEKRLPVRAFVRAAYGWDDEAEVQYPDAHKPADSKTGVSATTVWFKNREENRVKHQRDRKSAIDHNYDLPDLLAAPRRQDAGNIPADAEHDQPDSKTSNKRRRRKRQRTGAPRSNQQHRP